MSTTTTNKNNNNNNNEEKDDKKTIDPEEEEEEEVVGLDEDEEIILSLKSQDDMVCKLDKDIAMKSELIKTMWSGDRDELTIPLPNVRGQILKKVVTFLERIHKNPMREIEKPLKSANMSEVKLEIY